MNAYKNTFKYIENRNKTIVSFSLSASKLHRSATMLKKVEQSAKPIGQSYVSSEFHVYGDPKLNRLDVTMVLRLVRSISSVSLSLSYLAHLLSELHYCGDPQLYKVDVAIALCLVCSISSVYI